MTTPTAHNPDLRHTDCTRRIGQPPRVAPVRSVDLRQASRLLPAEARLLPDFPERRVHPAPVRRGGRCPSSSGLGRAFDHQTTGALETVAGRSDGKVVASRPVPPGPARARPALVY